METKQIIITQETKQVKPKEIKKRIITQTPKWATLKEISETSKTDFIHQQIKNKLHSYRSQDIEKKKFDQDKFADLSGVLQKLSECDLKCYYCKGTVELLYENVREPKQWTLERIDNNRGHNLDNVEIACLSCNLRRRTMKPERYVLTKKIQTIIKCDHISIVSSNKE